VDYVFGVQTPTERNLLIGIWPEINYVWGAAASIMEECSVEALTNGCVQEALSIMRMAVNLDKDVSQEVFDSLDKTSETIRFETNHFIFAFMTIPALRILMEDDELNVVKIMPGSDHRKCVASEDGCTNTPTAEQLENGWVPWETEEVKS
jgi:hypothetical protein